MDEITVYYLVGQDKSGHRRYANYSEYVWDGVRDKFLATPFIETSDEFRNKVLDYFKKGFSDFEWAFYGESELSG